MVQSMLLDVTLQAVNTQEANKAASNRLPPLWAMVAMVLLGWNEAMSILTSPLKLVSPSVLRSLPASDLLGILGLAKLQGDSLLPLTGSVHEPLKLHP